MVISLSLCVRRTNRVCLTLWPNTIFGVLYLTINIIHEVGACGCGCGVEGRGCSFCVLTQNVAKLILSLSFDSKFLAVGSFWFRRSWRLSSSHNLPTKLDITVHTYVLAPNSAKPSADTKLTQKLHMYFSNFLWLSVISPFLTR